MTKNSLLAAALAFASFTALPALAQSTPATTMPPAASTAAAPVPGSVQTDAHKLDKTGSKVSEKAGKEGKSGVKAMPHADAKAASDSTTTTAPVSK